MSGGAFRWAHAGRPLPGEAESGDAHVAALFDGGALVAVIDGLGHGHEAAAAARLAAGVFSADPADPPVDLVRRSHEVMRGSRGAALLVCSLSDADRTCRWVGVGNVEGVRFRRTDRGVAREALLSAAGVVGYQIPTLRERSGDLRPGDLLVLATDGIAPRFLDDLGASGDDDPAAVAAQILARCARPTDDALVLVVAYRGATA